jgi:itaconate CoA-transferase
MSDQVLSMPSIATDPRFSTPHARVTNRVELDTIIGKLFSEIDSEDLQSLLLDASIAFGQLNSTQGLATHPQLRTTVYETEGGPIEVVAPAVMDINAVLSTSSMPVTSSDASTERGEGNSIRVPALGEHTDRIRAEFS